MRLVGVVFAEMTDLVYMIELKDETRSSKGKSQDLKHCSQPATIRMEVSIPGERYSGIRQHL